MIEALLNGRLHVRLPNQQSEALSLFISPKADIQLLRGALLISQAPHWLLDAASNTRQEHLVTEALLVGDHQPTIPANMTSASWSVQKYKRGLNGIVIEQWQSHTYLHQVPVQELLDHPLLYILHLLNRHDITLKMESNQQKHKLINPLTRYEDFKFELPPNTYPKQVLQTSFKYPPDCGEKSYVGSGRLKGRHALITGGDSGMGRAVVSKQFQHTLTVSFGPMTLISFMSVAVSLLDSETLSYLWTACGSNHGQTSFRSTPTSFVQPFFMFTWMTESQNYSRVCS